VPLDVETAFPEDGRERYAQVAVGEEDTQAARS
jgi:hypothetical protein